MKDEIPVACEFFVAHFCMFSALGGGHHGRSMGPMLRYGEARGGSRASSRASARSTSARGPRARAYERQRRPGEAQCVAECRNALRSGSSDNTTRPCEPQTGWPGCSHQLYLVRQIAPPWAPRRWDRFRT